MSEIAPEIKDTDAGVIPCHECGDDVPMLEAVADPNGNPLCKKCFNKLAGIPVASDDDHEGR